MPTHTVCMYQATLLHTHHQEIASMDEYHYREVRGGGGSEGSEDIEEEAVLTDRLGAKELGQRHVALLGTTWGVLCTIQYPWYWKRRTARIRHIIKIDAAS